MSLAVNGLNTNGSLDGYNCYFFNPTSNISVFLSEAYMNEGTFYHLRNLSAYNVTLYAVNSETIDGSASLVLGADEKRMICAYSDVWYTI